jgi:hypothetical protein
VTLRLLWLPVVHILDTAWFLGGVRDWFVCSVPYNSGTAREYFGGLSYDGYVAGIIYIDKYKIICFFCGLFYDAMW